MRIKSKLFLSAAAIGVKRSITGRELYRAAICFDSLGEASQLAQHAAIILQARRDLCIDLDRAANEFFGFHK